MMLDVYETEYEVGNYRCSDNRCSDNPATVVVISIYLDGEISVILRR